MKNKITPKEALADLSKANMVDGRLPLIVKAKMSVVEQALKNYENLKVKYEDLCNRHKKSVSIETHETLMRNYNILEEENQKQSEILDILKNKKVDVWRFIDDFAYGVIEEEKHGFQPFDYDYYLRNYRTYSDILLTKTEFNLIKEWLNND